MERRGSVLTCKVGGEKGDGTVRTERSVPELPVDTVGGCMPYRDDVKEPDHPAVEKGMRTASSLSEV